MRQTSLREWSWLLRETQLANDRAGTGARLPAWSAVALLPGTVLPVCCSRPLYRFMKLACWGLLDLWYSLDLFFQVLYHFPLAYYLFKKTCNLGTFFLALHYCLRLWLNRLWTGNGEEETVFQTVGIKLCRQKLGQRLQTGYCLASFGSQNYVV